MKSNYQVRESRDCFPVKELSVSYLITFLCLFILDYPGRLLFASHGFEFVIMLRHFFEWLDPFKQFALDPFSGLSPMFGIHSVQAWWNPGYLPFLWFDSYYWQIFFAGLIFFTALFSSVILLGRTFLLSYLQSIIVAQLICFGLITPAFLDDFPGGHLMYYPVILWNITLALFNLLGNKSKSANIAIVLALPLLVIYNIWCDTIYSLAYVYNYLFFGICSFFIAIKNRNWLWKLLGICFALFFLHILDIDSFVLAYIKYNARAIFTNEIMLNSPYNLKFGSLLVTKPVMFVLLLIGITLAYRFNKARRSFILFVFLSLFFYVIYDGLFFLLEINCPYPKPRYMQLTALTFYLFAAVVGFSSFPKAYNIADYIPMKIKNSFSFLRSHYKDYMVVFLIPLLVFVYCEPLHVASHFVRRVSPGFDRFAVDKLGRNPLPPTAGDVGLVRKTAIIDTLIKEISLKPGQPFRGSVVVYYYGIDDSPVAKRIGTHKGAPFDLRIWNKSFEMVNGEFGFANHGWGGAHAESDLLYFDIPSIDQLSMAISPHSYMFYSRILYEDKDYPWHNRLVVRSLNTRVLKGLGARFVITDRMLSGQEFKLRQEIQGKGGLKLRLYEILDTNMANYSPINIYVSKKASETISMIKKEDFFFDKDVVLENNLDHVALVPVSESQMVFEETGIRVQAVSDGVSVLLLPLEFSNCLVAQNLIPDQNVKEPNIMRANFVQTAILFKDKLDIRIDFNFSFSNHECRQKDIDDMEESGLRELEIEKEMPAWLYPYSLKRLL